MWLNLITFFRAVLIWKLTLSIKFISKWQNLIMLKYYLHIYILRSGKAFWFSVLMDLKHKNHQGKELKYLIRTGKSTLPGFLDLSRGCAVTPASQWCSPCKVAVNSSGSWVADPSWKTQVTSGLLAVAWLRPCAEAPQSQWTDGRSLSLSLCLSWSFKIQTQKQ